MNIEDEFSRIYIQKDVMSKINSYFKKMLCLKLMIIKKYKQEN